MFRVSADVSQFHQELLAAARESGDRSLVFRIRSLRLFPRALARLHDECCQEVVERYEANDDSLPAGAVSYSTGSDGVAIYGVNWEGLAGFLKEILPLVVELLPVILKLFGV
jgi:hypothetical protein